jgi:hypothetical protein
MPEIKMTSTWREGRHLGLENDVTISRFYTTFLAGIIAIFQVLGSDLSRNIYVM